MQLVNGIITLPVAGFGGVAWWAHIGGFLAGYFLIGKMIHRARY
jgi:membrane associated rhomboid family serine protease